MTDTFVPDESHAEFDDWQAAQEFAQFHEMSNRITYLNSAAPYLADDPEVVTTIANMPIPMDQLGYLAGSASAMMRLDGTKSDLEHMEPGKARQIFNQLTASQQEALLQMGYQPPATGDEQGSNPILGALGSAGGAIMGGVNTFLTETPVVSDVFDWMNKLQNGVNTLYRNISTDDQRTLALLTAAATAVGVAAAPFTGGLSLGATAAISAGAGLAAGNLVANPNPSDFIEASKDNWNGETVFSNSAQARVRGLLQSSGLDVVARDIGWEMDPWETVKLFASTPEADSDQAFIASIDRILDRVISANDPRREEYAQKLITLMQIPQFRESVEILQNSKTSFGRDVAGFLGLDPGDTGYGFVSGAADALFLVTTDPTLAAGAALKWRRATRLGVPISDEGAFDTINAIARKAEELPSIGRAYDEIAAAVNNDTPHVLWRRVPDAKGMYDDLWNYKRLRQEQGTLGDEGFTRDHIFDWMSEGNNFQIMLKGHGVKQGYGRLMLPTYGWTMPGTNRTLAVGKVWERAKAAIDYADDNAIQAHLRKLNRELRKIDPDTLETGMIPVKAKVTGALRYSAYPDDEFRHLRTFMDVLDHVPVVNQMVRWGAQVAGSFTEMMPATRSISMVGPQAADDIQRLVGLGRFTNITSVERKAWFDTIMQQDNIEHRINAALSYLDTMLTSGGVRSSERGAELADQFINKIRHRYSLGPADQYLMGERTVARGLHPYQHTFDLPIPNLKELRDYTARGYLMKYIHHALDSDPVDFVMNKVWKPAVLLRIGFITRAGGEELLSLLARAGPSAIINEFGARSIAEGRLHSQAMEAMGELKRGLTKSQIAQIERMRYAAHVRPLERMFSNWEWTKPANELLARWTDFLRNGLERGIFPGLADRIPESRRLALLGREGGFRRSLTVGVDPDMIRYAETFGRVHAASIMKEVSAHNASVAHELRQGDFQMRYQDPSGEWQELGFVTEKGRFKVYRKNDTRIGNDILDRMNHAGAAAILHDPVVGPQYTNVTTRYTPPTISDEQAHGILNQYRAIDDQDLKAIVDELLTHNDDRTSMWESMLRKMQQRNPALADLLRTTHPTLRSRPDEIDRVLKTYRQWLHQRYGMNPSSGYGAQLMPQITEAETLLRTVASAGSEADRAWMGSFLDFWGKVPDTPRLIRDFQQFRTELDAYVADAHYAIDNPPLVKSLPYMNQLPDGTMVAHPPREGMVRLFVPQMSAEAYGRMLAELRIGGGQQFVNEMVRQWVDAAPHIKGLHVGQINDIIAHFANRIGLERTNKMAQHAMDVAAAGRHGNVIPLTWMGFDDPDVAQALSLFMNSSFSGKASVPIAERIAQAKGYVAQLDLDDALRGYNPIQMDGAGRPLAYTDREWRTEIIEPERSIDIEVTTPGAPARPAGAVAFGGSGEAQALAYEERLDAERLRGMFAGFPSFLETSAPGTESAQFFNNPPTPAYPGRAIGSAAGPTTTETVTDVLPAVTGQVQGPARVTERVIHSWGLDPEYLTPRTVSLADRELITLPDGTRQYGAHPDEALRAGVQNAVTDFLYHITDTTQRRITREVLFRDPDGFERIPIGTELTTRDEAYRMDKKGRAVQVEYDDRAAFDLLEPEMGSHLFENWTMIGPLLRDATDNMRDVSRLLPDTRDIKNMPAALRAARGQQSPGIVRQFRGHWTHVSDLQHAPQVAVGPALRPLKSPTRWEKVLEFGFDKTIAPALDAIVRRPLAFHMFAEAMRENERATRWMLSPHLFGDEVTGDIGQLEKRFGQLVDDNMLDVRLVAQQIHETTRVIQPDLYAELSGLDDADVVNAYLGQWADDNLYRMDLEGQLKAAQAAVARTRGVAVRNAMHNAGRGTKLRTNMNMIKRNVPGIEEREIVKGILDWTSTGTRPRGWDNVPEQMKPSLDKTIKDLRDNVDQFELVGDFTLEEWDRAMTIGNALIDQPRWALPLHQVNRKGEAALQAYSDQLGDQLLRPWHEAGHAIAALPAPLRDALDESKWQVLSAGYANKSRIGRTIEELAADRSIRNSLPYLDSHEIRSQAGEYVRGFFPFMYAEENFLKRWARTLKVAPDALRKGQLLYHGLKSGGVVRTDSQGRDWFVYPGAGAVAEALNRATAWTGMGEVMPSGVVFASEPKSMLPGFDIERTGMPSANPLVAVPIGALASKFHELRPIHQSVVGQAGLAQGGVRQFIPTAIRRLWDAVDDSDSNVKYASAMASAAAILEYNGNGLPPDATPNQLDDYIRRLRDHTRMILTAQAFVGFITPGAPSIQFTGESQLDMSNLTGLNTEIPADVFRNEFIELVQELGIDEGMAAYLALNPDHNVENLLAYSVGQTTSVSGAPLPATAEAVAFADDNQGWIEQYPMAAAWMLPQPDEDEEIFDEYAYVQQTISGMRQRRTPEDFLRALKFREGSIDYFKSRDEFERKMAENADSPENRRVLQDLWDQYASQHKATHPIFTEELEGGESRERRNRVLGELRTAVNDPATPQVKHLEPMREMIYAFDWYKTQLAQFSEDRSEKSQQRIARLKALYADVTAEFLLDNPGLEPLWLSVLRPEASL